MTNNKSEATNAELEDAIKANEEFNEENQRLKKELTEARRQATYAKNQVDKYKTLAKNNQTLNSTRFEAENNQVGQDGERYFDGDELVKVDTQQLDEDYLKEKAKKLAFMDELITVEIHEVSDENADHGFPVWVNGEPEFFFRGQIKTVKRKFVEGLARAKKTGYRCVERVNQDGVREFYYPSHTGLRFPFSVIEDQNPYGREWLKTVLRQP